jgi:hypothetical protein
LKLSLPQRHHRQLGSGEPSVDRYENCYKPHLGPNSFQDSLLWENWRSAPRAAQEIAVYRNVGGALVGAKV